MLNRLSLRARVTLAYGLMGLMLSIGFAVAARFVADDYEHIVVDKVLTWQAGTLLQHIERDPDAVLPVSKEFAAYRERDAPPEFRGLPAGVHELELPGREGLHAGVYGPDGNRLVLIVDIGIIEGLEDYLDRLMLVIVLVGAVLSAWLGWLFAGRTVAPVGRLADAVESLPTQPVPTRLGSGFGRDEVGRLAAAIDAYQRRLVEAGEQERLFYANANHELRTPIAVIQGAVEVMRDDPEFSAEQLPRLARIERAALELGLMLEALMLSARGSGASSESIDLVEVARQARDRMATAHPDAAARIRLEGERIRLRLRPRVLECILTVLFHRLLNMAPPSTWIVRFEDRGFQVDSQEWVHGSTRSHRQSDLGLGLMFIERLCRDSGWKLHLQSDPAEPLQIRVTFPAAASALP